MTFFSLSESIEICRQILLPNEHHDTIFSIQLEMLYNKGFRTLVLDVDNTLMSYDQKELNLDTLNWLQKSKNIGFNVFFVSNNSSKRRIKKICTQADIKGTYFSCKPLPFTLRELAKKHFFSLKKTIVVGDQLLTDIILGNWLKSYSILVNPLKKSSVIKMIQNDIETFVLEKLTP